MGLAADPDYRSWSGSARAMALAIDVAVSAARSGDGAAFADATSELARVDREQLAVVLGAVTRDLLERAHPDGLDPDDAEQVLQSAIRSAASWYRDLDSDSLLLALTGAIGLSDLDELPERDGPAVLAHGLLLIGDLLTGVAEALPPVLDGALRELRRAQTVELP
ncbi:MAG: hypothetical protein ACRDOI_35875 [Trebonia sp.]